MYAIYDIQEYGNSRRANGVVLAKRSVLSQDFTTWKTYVAHIERWWPSIPSGTFFLLAT